MELVDAWKGHDALTTLKRLKTDNTSWRGRKSWRAAAAFSRLPLQMPLVGCQIIPVGRGIILGHSHWFQLAISLTCYCCTTIPFRRLGFKLSFNKGRVVDLTVAPRPDIAGGRRLVNVCWEGRYVAARNALPILVGMSLARERRNLLSSVDIKGKEGVVV